MKKIKHLESDSNTTHRTSLLGWVFLVFLVLKLAEIGPVATWSWWWVTAPLWGGLAIALAIAGIWVTALYFVSLVSAFSRGFTTGAKK